MVRPARRKRTSRDPEQVRETILSAFSKRAKESGIRGVVMSELASQLRMSATTLYNHFASKEELVRELVLLWVDELSASEAGQPDQGGSPIEVLLRWSSAWAENVARYSPAFWEDLRRDYPDAWQIFRRELNQRKAAGAEMLRPFIDRGLSADMALATLDIILTHAPSPKLCNRLGISRAQAVETAIRVWANGALHTRGKVKPQ